MRSLIRHLVNLILWPFPPTRLFAMRRVLLRLAGVGVGANARVSGRGWIYGAGDIYIGQDSWLSPGVVAYTHRDAAIHIGERCDIGPEVRFVTGSHQIGPRQRRAGQGTALPIVVGNGCWIGAGATLLGGVTIGDGSIVAAGAVVRANVPPDTLVAGVPATPRKSL